MQRHFRRYYFLLAERLHMTVTQLLNNLDSHELSEWMAYDMTTDEEWVKEYRMQQQTAEQQSAALKNLFRAK